MPYALTVALWLLAAASVWTVGQRIVLVYRSAREQARQRSGAGPDAGPGRPDAEPVSDACASGPRALRLADAEYAAAWRLVGRRARPGWRSARSGSAPTLAARRGGAGARRLRANLARVVPAAPPAAAGRAGPGRSAQLRPVLVRGVPAAPDGPGRPSTGRWTAQLSGADPFFARAAAPAAAWCSRCRTAATGTPPGCGWWRRCAGCGREPVVHHGGPAAAPGVAVPAVRRLPGRRSASRWWRPRTAGPRTGR